MYKFSRLKIVWLPILFFFIAYLFWLFRAYYDVAYMDQIQIVAGNINHMLNHDATLHDYYYRPPFLLTISTILVFINCKLFAYNTFYENIVSAILLTGICLYFIKSNIGYFKSEKYKFYLSVTTALIVFCFVKWEMSLWGGGFSHYMVVFFGFICLRIVHNYYLNGQAGEQKRTPFIPLYIALSIVSILETTSYFLPFQVSLLILMVINYRIFKDRIDLKKWKIALGTTVGLLIFSFVVNYLAERYSISHPYDAYGKANLSQSLAQSLKKMSTEPGFFIKFFLIANAGNLVDKDSYAPTTFGLRSMPMLGFLVLVFYCYALLLFIKRKRIEGLLSVGLIIYSVVFCGTVLLGRLGFNDLYYGASSRYSSATFSGTLGLSTFFLLLRQGKATLTKYQKLIYSLPIVLASLCSIIINRNQWRIAPYRKENFLQMAQDFKSNEHLEHLMGYNNEITAKAREVLIRNKLNVFKPEQKLEEFPITCEQIGRYASGFYEVERDQYGNFRWTDGNAVIFLPNLYTVKDTIHVQLMGYPPQADTPNVFLNDHLSPFQVSHLDGGYEYSFAFQEQKVLFKASIQNRSTVPHEVNKDNPDNRTLGLIFRALILRE